MSLPDCSVPAPSTTTIPNPPPVVRHRGRSTWSTPSLHLTPRNRNVAPPANLTQIVNRCCLGPDGRGVGRRDPELRLRGSPVTGANRAVVTVANGIATVDFATNPVQVVGASQTLLAIAQVVFTVTQQANVTGVLFQIAGQPIEVPIGPNGALVPGPVNQAQYPAQAPVTTATP